MPLVFSFAVLHQQVKTHEGFYQAFVYGQLLHFLSPSGIILEASTSKGRSDMVLHKLRQIHEFKMLSASGAQYDRNRVFASALSVG
jgi:hypothetical protein